MSLKLRLNIMITCLLIIMMIIGAWVMFFSARENVRAEIDSTANLALQLLDREILFFNKQGFEPNKTGPFDLSSLSNIRHLRVEYFDKAGNLKDTNQVNLFKNQQNKPPALFVRLMHKITPMEDYTRQVVFNDEYAGELVITPDPSYEVEEIWDGTKGLLGLVFIFFIAVNAMVYGAIDSALKPVKHILDALANLEKGDLATRLPSFDLPELASIASKFNHTAQILEKSVNRNVRLSRELIHLEEVERKNLARDLHDEIGQSITAINMDAQAILNYQLFDDQNIAKLRLSAKAILDVTKQMMGITHQILEKLRPDALDKLGLQEALQGLVTTWQRKRGIDCRINISGDFNNLSEDISMAAYRVIQESLTNVARYAQAKSVSINVLEDADCLVLMIEDDGIGFDITKVDDGYGLLGMRERVEGLGGDFELGSIVGEGTHLVIRLPLVV